MMSAIPRMPAEPASSAWPPAGWPPARRYAGRPGSSQTDRSPGWWPGTAFTGPVAWPPAGGIPVPVVHPACAPSTSTNDPTLPPRESTDRRPLDLELARNAYQAGRGPRGRRHAIAALAVWRSRRRAHGVRTRPRSKQRRRGRPRRTAGRRPPPAPGSTRAASASSKRCLDGEPGPASGRRPDRGRDPPGHGHRQGLGRASRAHPGDVRRGRGLRRLVQRARRHRRPQRGHRRPRRQLFEYGQRVGEACQQDFALVGEAPCLAQDSGARVGWGLINLPG